MGVGFHSEPPIPPSSPPIRKCVHCGRGFYTSMRPPVCLDCRCPAARRPAPDPDPRDVLDLLDGQTTTDLGALAYLLDLLT